MKTAYCEFHPKDEVILVCLQPKCAHRLVCLRCTQQHSRHDLVSLQHFTTQVVPNLHQNRNNPQRSQIYKKISSGMEMLVQKLQSARNKLNALLGSCEDKIEKYFGQLLSSFAVHSQKQIQAKLENEFNSELVSVLLEQIKKVEGLTVGTLDQVSSAIYFTKEMFDQKVNQMINQSSLAINSLISYVSQISLAKPPKFQLAFSRDKLQKGLYVVSDQGLSVQRILGTGNFPLCLGATPFSPFYSKFSIKLEKSLNNRSVCFGACLQNIVKVNNFINCCGLGKGIYAIDQNSPYSSGTMMASWNHHDTQFNQNNVGSNDLVGWTFMQGDTITINIDYYNSTIAFYKQASENDDVPVYEMPIKLDAGPIYPFVSLAYHGDTVKIVECADFE